MTLTGFHLKPWDGGWNRIESLNSAEIKAGMKFFPFRAITVCRKCLVTRGKKFFGRKIFAK